MSIPLDADLSFCDEIPDGVLALDAGRRRVLLANEAALRLLQLKGRARRRAGASGCLTWSPCSMSGATTGGNARCRCCAFPACAASPSAGCSW